LRLYASTHCALDDVGPQQEALQSHVVLRPHDGNFTFRFDFLADYLAARVLVENLSRRPMERRAIEVLARHARGGSGFMERALDRLFTLGTSKWETELSAAWSDLQTEGSPQAKSGLLHLILKGVEREVASGPRIDRTNALYRVLGLPKGAPLRNVYLEGGYMGRVQLRKCRFCELCVRFGNAVSGVYVRWII